MSLTEEARAPFSLVDEINQVRAAIFRGDECISDAPFIGYGPTG